MSYKFTRLSPVYPEYINNFYLRHPGMEQQLYSKQLTNILNDSFGRSNFIEINLEKIGIQAYTIIVNIQQLQYAWIKENGFKDIENDLKMAQKLNNTKLIKELLDRIVLEQLRKINPTILYIENFLYFDNVWIRMVKENIPSIKKVIIYCGSLYNNNNIPLFKEVDALITCHKGLFNRMINDGINCFIVNHAFEKTLLPRIEENNNFPHADVIFSGALFQGLHNERRQILEKLVKQKIEICIYTNLNKIGWILLLKRFIFKVYRKAMNYFMPFIKIIGFEMMIEKLPFNKINNKWSEFSKYFDLNFSDILNPYIKKSIYGIDMYKAFHNSKIIINSHGDGLGDYAGNMRLFEATGAGGCLVTDWKEDLHEFFEIDKEVVAYKSIDECIEKIKWLLSHPIERDAIAKAGQIRTLKDHTYKKRAIELDEIIKNYCR